jgi:tetratricopeptide (TPR) repeat protein
MSTSEPLRDIEAKAFEAQYAGDYAAAIGHWLNLVRRQPNWESGNPYYNLANCYFEMGRIAEAEEAYRKAADIAPEDDMFVDALNSLIEARRAGYL